MKWSSLKNGDLSKYLVQDLNIALNQQEMNEKLIIKVQYEWYQNKWINHNYIQIDTWL